MPSGCGFLSPQETRGLTAHGSPNSSLMAVRGITTLETLADEDAASGTRVWRRRSPLFCHSFVLARAVKVFWETLESASALEKACAARHGTPADWTRLVWRAGGLPRLGQGLCGALDAEIVLDKAFAARWRTPAAWKSLVPDAGGQNRDAKEAIPCVFRSQVF